MPEFVLDRGDAASAAKFKALDSFTQGYVECMFFTGHGDLAYATFADLAPETLAKIIEDCAAFQELADKSLQLAYDYAPSNYDAAHAGHDFWLTRNGHGAGFWDRGFGDLRTDTIGGRLSADAKSFGSCDPYCGDDGKVYLS